MQEGSRICQKRLKQQSQASDSRELRTPTAGAAPTQQVQHQVLRGREGVLEVEGRVAPILDLSQRLEIPQQDVPEPLCVHAWDPPLFGLLILQTTGSVFEEKSQLPDVGLLAV